MPAKQTTPSVRNRQSATPSSDDDFFDIPSLGLDPSTQEQSFYRTCQILDKALELWRAKTATQVKAKADILNGAAYWKTMKEARAIIAIKQEPFIIQIKAAKILKQFHKQHLTRESLRTWAEAASTPPTDPIITIEAKVQDPTDKRRRAFKVKTESGATLFLSTEQMEMQAGKLLFLFEKATKEAKRARAATLKTLAPSTSPISINSRVLQQAMINAQKFMINRKHSTDPKSPAVQPRPLFSPQGSSASEISLKEVLEDEMGQDVRNRTQEIEQEAEDLTSAQLAHQRQAALEEAEKALISKNKTTAEAVIAQNTSKSAKQQLQGDRLDAHFKVSSRPKDDHIQQLIADATPPAGEHTSEDSSQTEAIRLLMIKMEAMQQQLQNVQSRSAAPEFTKPYSDFDIGVDAHVKTIATSCGLEKAAASNHCLNPDCSRQVPCDEDVCICGCPTSILDFCCPIPSCGHPMKGSVSDMLQRTHCSKCFFPLKFKMTTSQHIELVKILRENTEPKYVSTPPPSLSTIPKEMRILEEDCKRTRHLRAGNSPNNTLVAATAKSAYGILTAIQKALEAGLPFSQLCDEKMPFEAKGKVLIAALKLSFGVMAPGGKKQASGSSQWSASITDLIATSPEHAVTAFIDWSKAALEAPSPIENWNAPDAELKIRAYFSFLTFLIRKVLSDSLAAEHEELCEVLLAAFRHEGLPKVDFAIEKLFERHSMAIAWFRAATDAYLEKSSYFLQFFGKDIEWHGFGTSAQRPKLYIRKMVNGRGQWTNFMVENFEARQQQLIKWSASKYAQDFGKATQGPHTGAMPAAKETIQVVTAPGITPKSPQEPITGAVTEVKQSKSKAKSLTPILLSALLEKNKGRHLKGQGLLWPNDPSAMSWTELMWTKIVCTNCLSKGHSCNKCKEPRHELAIADPGCPTITTWSVEAITKANKVSTDKADEYLRLFIAHRQSAKANSTKQAAKTSKQEKQIAAAAPATKAQPESTNANKKATEANSRGKQARQALAALFTPTAPTTPPTPAAQPAATPTNKGKQPNGTNKGPTRQEAAAAVVPTIVIPPLATSAKATPIAKAAPNPSALAAAVAASEAAQKMAAATARTAEMAAKKVSFAQAAARNIPAAPHTGKQQPEQTSKLEDWIQEAPHPSSSTRQLSMLDLSATMDIQDFIQHQPSLEQIEAHPILGSREVLITIPGLESDQPHLWSARAFCRGMKLPTKTGIQLNRCRFIAIAAGANVDASALFDNAYDDSKLILSSGFAKNYEHLAAAEVVATMEKHTRQAHNGVCVRSQMTSNFWMRTAFPALLQGQPVLECFTIKGKVFFQLYILAASSDRCSQLDHNVAHTLAHEEHSFQLQWNNELPTLRQVLAFLQRIYRFCDVTVHLCMQASDTTTGKTPIMPSYLEWARPIIANMRTTPSQSTGTITEGTHAAKAGCNTSSQPPIETSSKASQHSQPAPHEKPQRSIFDLLSISDEALGLILAASMKHEIKRHTEAKLPYQSVKESTAEFYLPLRKVRWAEVEGIITEITDSARKITDAPQGFDSIAIATKIDDRARGFINKPKWFVDQPGYEDFQPEIFERGQTPIIDDGIVEANFPIFCLYLAETAKHVNLRAALSSFCKSWHSLLCCSKWVKPNQHNDTAKNWDLKMKIHQALCKLQTENPETTKPMDMWAPPGEIQNQIRNSELSRQATITRWELILKKSSSEQDTSMQLIMSPSAAQPNPRFLQPCTRIINSNLRCRAWLPAGQESICRGCQSNSCECSDCNAARDIEYFAEKTHRRFGWAVENHPQPYDLAPQSSNRSEYQTLAAKQLTAVMQGIDRPPELLDMDHSIIAKIMGQSINLTAGSRPTGIFFSQEQGFEIAREFVINELNLDPDFIDSRNGDTLVRKCLSAALHHLLSSNELDLASAMDSKAPQSTFRPISCIGRKELDAAFLELCMSLSMLNNEVSTLAAVTQVQSSWHCLRGASRECRDLFSPVISRCDDIIEHLFTAGPPTHPNDFWYTPREDETHTSLALSRRNLAWAVTDTWMALTCHAKPPEGVEWPIKRPRIKDIRILTSTQLYKSEEGQLCDTPRLASQAEHTWQDQRFDITGDFLRIRCQWAPCLAGIAGDIISAQVAIQAIREQPIESALIWLEKQTIFKKHAAIANIMTQITDWRTSNLGISDSTELEIADALDMLINTSKSITWQYAIKDCIKQAATLRAVHPKISLAIPARVLLSLHRTWHSAVSTPFCPKAVPTIQAYYAITQNLAQSFSTTTNSTTVPFKFLRYQVETKRGKEMVAILSRIARATHDKGVMTLRIQSIQQALSLARSKKEFRINDSEREGFNTESDEDETRRSHSSSCPTTPNNTIMQSNINEMAALQVDHSKSPLSRYKQARIRALWPADHYDWLQRQMAKCSAPTPRRSERVRNSQAAVHAGTKRPAPSRSPESMNTEESSSVSEDEFQRAMGQQGPPAAALRLNTKRASKFQAKCPSPQLSSKTNATIDWTQAIGQLDPSMRLPSSANIKEAVKNRKKQSTISFKPIRDRNFQALRPEEAGKHTTAGFQLSQGNVASCKSQTAIYDPFGLDGKLHCPKPPLTGSSKVGSKHARSNHSPNEQLRAARELFWATVQETEMAADPKLASRSAAWRESFTKACAIAYEAVLPAAGRPLKELALLVRSIHPDRAAANVNPTQVAVATQPAIKEGLMSQSEADVLISIAQIGVLTEEFRDFKGKALDLRSGKPPEGEDAEVLKDFYFEQAALGRILIFPEEMEQTLCNNPEVILSPSFVVRAPNKKPRAILHLSSTAKGCNQRMVDTCEANEDGYSTIVDVARMILTAVIKMCLYPEMFSIDDIAELELLLIVMDGDSAFFRFPVGAECIGIQATIVLGFIIIPLCLTFGWKRSAEIFSHGTAAIQKMHASNLDSARFLAASFPLASSKHIPCEALTRLQNDKNPAHSHESTGHVDDFAALEILQGRRPQASAADLAWAIKVILGSDGISAKKFKESSFWADFQKLIGAWFDVSSFTVTMPHNKVTVVVEILESEDFQPDKTEFEINAVASLRGKMRWAGYATALGDCPCLINIERQRKTGESGSRKVKPWRHFGESEELCLKKFHNDLLIRKLFFKAAEANPTLASASLLSVLPMRERLLIPGQPKWLAWISGDFSMEGQSFGFECDHPKKVRLYSFIAHPPEIIAMLRKTLAGLADLNGNVIMSSVLERQNKLFAEAQWAHLLAGRPTICLDDNQGSVACMESGYARNPAMQMMQLVSGLRQARDQARMMAAYVNTENMSIFDAISRPSHHPGFIEKANAELETPWLKEEPSETVIALSNWLAKALEDPLPMLDKLTDSFRWAEKAEMPPSSMDLTAVASPSDHAWQDRIRAAVSPIPHTWPGGWLGSFGPQAYRTEHLEPLCPESGATIPDLKTLRSSQQHSLAAPNESFAMFDAFSGGCSATLAAIAAGLRIIGGSEVEPFEITLFEHITSSVSLGDIDMLDTNKMPSSHVFTTCSLCQDFSALGRNKMPPGIFGERGSRFPKQFRLAAASDAACVVWENVIGVASMHGGIAIKELRAEAEHLGYGKHFYHKEVVFAEHGEPENRVRIVGVAFNDRVQLKAPFEYPKPLNTQVCAGEFMLASTAIPFKCWEKRKWTKLPRKSGAPPFLRTMGFCDPKDTVGTPDKRSRVWHMMGLCPTMLASGNSQLVLAFRMKQLCPLYSAFRAWATSCLEKVWRPPQIGSATPRSLTTIEVLSMRNYPLGYPSSPEKDVFRCVGGGIPIRYMTRLYRSIIKSFTAAGVQTSLTPNKEAYQTQGNVGSFQIFIRTEVGKALAIWVSSFDSVNSVIQQITNAENWAPQSQRLSFAGKPLRSDRLLQDYNLKQGDTLHLTFILLGGSSDPQNPKVRSGFSIFRNKPRRELIATPVERDEWQAMANTRRDLRMGQFAESSKEQIRLGVDHWDLFCRRFQLPKYLLVNSAAGIRRATAQGELFLIYELACFDIKATSVCAKLWSVSQDHLDKRLPDPFDNNSVLDAVRADAIKRDRPQVPKIPVTERIIAAVQRLLDLANKKAFILLNGLKFAMSFCCRVSEWAFGEKHAVKWRYLTFFDSEGNAIDIISSEQLSQIAELEAVFMTDKTHRMGNGSARSIFATTDPNDSDCVARNIAKMWLASDRNPDHFVFSWDSGTAGVKRTQINKILKQAGIDCGIPAADVSSHSLRIGGLCLLMAHGMPFEDARAFGRWVSDCVRRYFWPSTSIARGFADRIWKPTRFTRVRGGGAVQRI